MTNKFRQNVESAIGWICRAQDADRSGGVPAHYMPLRGWSAPYPETTGYIIPTFVQLSKHSKRPDLLERAIRMGDWLVSIQMQNGAFQAGTWVEGRPASPSIFNSGQILFGLVALAEATNDPKWATAAQKCALWIKDQQEPNGSWLKYAYRETLHVYKSRVAWALALASVLLNEPRFAKAARSNVEHALSCQHENGWFDHASFKSGTSPVLHTFVYTVRGVLETGIVLGERQYVDAATKSGISMLKAQMDDGSLPGVVDTHFSKGGFRCVTGIAQQVIVWNRLAQRGIETKQFSEATEAALGYLASVQISSPGHVNHGGFPGSDPLWGPYMRFRYPNWAAKFFLDAVLTSDPSFPSEVWV